MDRAFFEQGETPQAFLASLGERRADYERQLQEVSLSEEHLRRITALPKGIKVMVIAEDWSGDVLYFLPVLLRIAEQANWDIRIFRRDRYPDLILPYRKEGLYHSIPVFVFFDPDFNEIGHWIERPAEATRVIEEESLKLRRRLREEHKEAWRREAVREILEIFQSPPR